MLKKHQENNGDALGSLELKCYFSKGGVSHGLFLMSSDFTNKKIDVERVVDKLLSYGKSETESEDTIGLPFHPGRVGVLDFYNIKSNEVYCNFYQKNNENNLSKERVSCGNLLFAVFLCALLEKKKDSPLMSLKNNVIKINDVNTGMTIYGRTLENTNSLASLKNIYLLFTNIVATKTLHLFPTGSTTNYIGETNKYKITCIDAAMPMVIIDAVSLGKKGDESPNELTKDKQLINRILNIRCQASKLMGLSTNLSAIIPKVCMVSNASDKDSTISMRYFTPFKCHPSYSITGIICLATACIYKGSVANVISKNIKQYENKLYNNQNIVIEHPEGKFSVKIYKNTNGERNISALVNNKAKIIFKGQMYLNKHYHNFFSIKKNRCNCFKQTNYFLKSKISQPKL